MSDESAAQKLPAPAGGTYRSGTAEMRQAAPTFISDTWGGGGTAHAKLE